MRSAVGFFLLLFQGDNWPKGATEMTAKSAYGLALEKSNDFPPA